MGDLIAFRSGEKSSGAPPQGGAQILFFTGVRYQRTTEGARDGAADEKSGKPGKGRRRIGNRVRRCDQTNGQRE